MGLRISDPPRKLRARIARANNTSYLAETDGEVEAQCSTENVELQGFTDNLDPPATKIASSNTGTSAAHITNAGTITFQVIKGDYWKVINATTVFWLPEN